MGWRRGEAGVVFYMVAMVLFIPHWIVVVVAVVVVVVVVVVVIAVAVVVVDYGAVPTAASRRDDNVHVQRGQFGAGATPTVPPVRPHNATMARHYQPFP